MLRDKNRTPLVLILLIALITGTLLLGFTTATSPSSEGLVAVPIDICPDIDLVDFISDIYCRVEQVRVLVPVLEVLRQWTPSNFDSEAFAEEFGFIRVGWEPDRNPRVNRMDELQLILIEATHIINSTSNIHDNYPIIVSFGAPSFVNSNYSIGLVSEEYLALVDLILEFTNIPRRRLEVRVTGLARTLQGPIWDW